MLNSAGTVHSEKRLVQRHPDSGTGRWPDLPGAVIHYLRHTVCSESLRSIAAELGCHASTIHRQIRKVESKRDDPVFDEALSSIVSHTRNSNTHPRTTRDPDHMNAPVRTKFTLLSDNDFRREALRVLRRLSEPGACLAYAADMEKAVVVRDTSDGRTVRTTVTSQQVVQSMVVMDWLVCSTPGRVARYRMTTAGHASLKRLLSEFAEHSSEFAEDQTPFADQHRDWTSRDIRIPDSERTRRVKYNSSESPVAVIARRKDKDGNPFLSADLVIAAERLREDFELSQMGPRIGQNWDKFLTGGDRGTFGGGESGNTSVERAKDRVMAALRHLGPGLADVALRVCCFLDGVESAEKKLGWSARSGKVVLRIALQRLHHYYETRGVDNKIG